MRIPNGMDVSPPLESDRRAPTVLRKLTAVTALVLLLSIPSQLVCAKEGPDSHSKFDATTENRVDADDLLDLIENRFGNTLDFLDLAVMGKEWYETTTPNNFTPTATRTPLPPTPTGTATWTPLPPTSTGTPTPTPCPSVAPTPTLTPVDPDLFYYYYDARLYLVPSETIIAVAFLPSVTEEQREDFVSDYADLAEIIMDQNQAFLPLGMYRIQLSRSIPWSELQDLLYFWSEDSRVTYVSPQVVVQGAISPFILVNSFSAKFSANISTAEIEAFNDQNNVQVLRPPTQNRPYYSLTPIGSKNALDSLYLANRYHESHLTDYSAPHFTPLLDSLLKSQERNSADHEPTFPNMREESNLFNYNYEEKIHLTPSLNKFVLDEIEVAEVPPPQLPQWILDRLPPSE